MKASILAIGTELTTGQIINKNAATISSKLKGLGIEVILHLTVPDERKLILNSLKFIEEHQPEMIFVTGGLGPTTDDFTRDVIAEWKNLKMNFDEDSWQHIQDRLSSRGFVIREMQKQQCYFPEAAEILSNSEGTANGFKLTSNKQTVYILPGPPREIEAIWNKHITTELSEKTKDLNKIITKSWDTLGKGESDVAFLVEEALKNRPEGLEIGYRVHLPYVEVKLSYRKSEENLWQAWVTKVEQAIGSLTIMRDFKDIAQICKDKIKNSDFTFYDFVSDGYLHARLTPELKNLKNWSFKQGTNVPEADLFESEDDFLALLPYEYDKCVLIYSFQGKRNQKMIEAPMKAESMKERRQQYFAEMALVELSRTKTSEI